MLVCTACHKIMSYCDCGPVLRKSVTPEQVDGQLELVRRRVLIEIKRVRDELKFLKSGEPKVLAITEVLRLLKAIHDEVVTTPLHKVYLSKTK